MSATLRKRPNIRSAIASGSNTRGLVVHSSGKTEFKEKVIACTVHCHRATLSLSKTSVEMVYSSGLPGLPNELIHAIAGCLETRDLLAVCRTSRHIHAICLERIYRSIILDDPAQSVKCCKAIIARPEAASSVYKFDMWVLSTRQHSIVYHHTVRVAKCGVP
jgi:hypothetical protein